MRWRCKELDKDRVRLVSQRYDIDALSASILVRRGLDEPQEALYLLESKKAYLLNPFLLPDMALATERMMQALGDLEHKDGRLQALGPEKIMIVGDRDADGITSTALLADFFISMGLSPILRLPQGDESYGVSCEIVQEAKQAGVTLIVCVDNGSSAFDAVTLARDLAIDVIIFDHHDVSEQVMPAYAFVNPKRSDTYANQQLSASVVVLKALFCLDFYLLGHFGRCDVLTYAAQNSQGQIQMIALQVINMEVRASLQITLDRNQEHLFEQDRQRMINFLQGRQIYIFGGDEQVALISHALGGDVIAYDLSDALEPMYPSLSQYRLAELVKRSRFFVYQEQPQLRDGLLLLYRLFLTMDESNYPNYNAGFGLASVGLLADLAPLLGENRIIVQGGLLSINSGEATALNRLLAKLNLLSTPITAHDLNWKFIPLINASGRMGEPDVALRAILSEDTSEQLELAKQLTLLNERRRDLTMQWWQQLQEPINKSLKKYDQQMVFICRNELPRGLTGLLAGRIARSYDCFSLVIAIKNNGIASASMRSPYAYHVGPFIEYCKDLFIDAGGHAQAGGFTLKVEHLDELEGRLVGFLSTLEQHRQNYTDGQADELFYDAKLPGEYFNKQLIEVYERFSPYGVKFEPLIFYVPKVILESATLIGRAEEHLKMGINVEGVRWQSLFWDAAQRFGELRAGMTLDILCKVRKEQGRYNGYQLELIDFKEAVE